MSQKFKMRPDQIQELARFANIADCEIRSDLAGGYISNENDYTSNFTGNLRRIINSNSKTGLKAKSFVLNPIIERDWGCDAAIIIKSNEECKIAIFEAKWPRIMKTSYRWDKIQTSKGLSHFTDQLDRQAIAAKKFPFAIFEMFYCEAVFKKQPKFMMPKGSSCIWHEEAMTFNNNRANRERVWSNTDLENLLTDKNKDIGKILGEVCYCNQGKPIPFFDVKKMHQEFSLPGDISLLFDRELD